MTKLVVEEANKEAEESSLIHNMEVKLAPLELKTKPVTPKTVQLTVSWMLGPNGLNVTRLVVEDLNHDQEKLLLTHSLEERNAKSLLRPKTATLNPALLTVL